MNQVGCTLTPEQTAAFNQLLTAISASDDRIVAASQKMSKVVDRTMSEMRQQVERLMETQERLQKTLIETTSQIKQIRQVSHAQSQAAGQKMGLEKALYEEIRQRVLETNREILRTSDRDFPGSRVSHLDVESLLSAYHGVDLLYQLENFQGLARKTHENEMKKRQEQVDQGILTPRYCRDIDSLFYCIKHSWLRKHFFSQNKGKDSTEPLSKLTPTQQQIDSFSYLKIRYVSVGSFALFPIYDVDYYLDRGQASQKKAPLSLPAPQKPLVVLQLEPEQRPLIEPPVSSALVLASSSETQDPLLGLLEQASRELMEQVSKTEQTARAVIPEMRRKIDTLTVQNRTLLDKLSREQRELTQVMATASEQEEAYRKEMASLPQKMEKVQKLWIEAVVQASDKTEREKQQHPHAEFFDLLYSFFDGSLDNAITALDRLKAAIPQDPRFTVQGKEMLIARYEAVKTRWKTLCIK